MHTVLGLFLLAVAGAGPTSETVFYEDKLDLLVWKDVGGTSHPVRTAGEWSRRRAHVLANMQAVMGPLPGEDRKTPLDVRVEDTGRVGEVIRKRITYALFGASDKLVAVYPDADHDFPP